MQQRQQNRGHRELQVSADMHWLRQTKCCHQLHTRQVGGKRRKENVREKSRDIIDYNLFSKRGRKAFSAWGWRWRDRCWQLSLALKTTLIQLFLRAIEPEIAVNWKELSNMINNCPSHQMAHRIYQSIGLIFHINFYFRSCWEGKHAKVALQLRRNITQKARFGSVWKRASSAALRELLCAAKCLPILS